MAKDRCFQLICSGAIAGAALIRRLPHCDATADELRLFKGWMLAGEEAARG